MIWNYNNWAVAHYSEVNKMKAWRFVLTDSDNKRRLAIVCGIDSFEIARKLVKHRIEKTILPSMRNKEELIRELYTSRWNILDISEIKDGEVECDF